jgi:beta-1,4-mannosyl-glycoprotein beta-1,4-N-acetylglucosaminyltransferase
MKLKNFKLKKKYAIFLQNHYVYKFNLFNEYDTPWEGTRICKFCNLKSINYMRQKVLLKNLRKWWRPDKERNIQIINNGGWHFKDIFTPKELSIKLKTFAHKEFSISNFSNLRTIRNKIKKKIDLYNKNQLFYKVALNKNFPKYILDNQKKLKSFID